MLNTFGEEYDTYVQLVGFYLAARLFMAAYCALTGILLPLVKGMSKYTALALSPLLIFSSWPCLVKEKKVLRLLL
jgi:hypothetical protein